MIRGSITITAAVEPELYEIRCNPDRIVLNPYNVQKEALEICLLRTIGIDSEVVKACFHLIVMSGTRQVGEYTTPSMTADFSYTLPSDKWGNATSVVVRAYSAMDRRDLIKERTLLIDVDSAREYFIDVDWVGIGSGVKKWSDYQFRNGEYIKIDKILYQWCNRVTGNTINTPNKAEAPNDAFAGSWKIIPVHDVLAGNVFLGDYAHLASAIFFENYMYSQHGTGTGTYAEFDPTKLGAKDCPFTPNLYVDWLLGKLVGDNIEMRGGSIGKLKIVGNKLVSEDLTETIEIGKDGELIYLTLGGNIPISISKWFIPNDIYPCFSINNYGNGPCIDLLGQGKDSLALRSHGSVKMVQRIGETWNTAGALFGATINGSTGKPITRWGEGAKVSDSDFSRLSAGVYRIVHHLGHNQFFVQVTAWKHGTKNHPMIANVIQKDTNEIAIRIVDDGGVVSDTNFEIVLIGRNKV